MNRNLLLSSLILLLSVTVALGLGEAMLRMKNASMQNYDIEMWRYAKELKTPSDNPILGHEHVPSSSAHLQSVDLRINDQGLRGGPVPTDRARRILFLGSSITLGWGVPEEATLTSVLQTRFDSANASVAVINGGIGNYNTVRYVERFLTQQTDLNPTDILVQYFINDAETLSSGGGNWFLRNSQLAVTLWFAINRTFGSHGKGELLEHYQAVYAPDAPGHQAMLASLERLADYAKEKGIRLYLVMTPDIHDLADYSFGFIHDELQTVAARMGYRYLDLLPALSQQTQQNLWAMPGDPHPNALAHGLMADAIYPLLTSGQ